MAEFEVDVPDKLGGSGWLDVQLEQKSVVVEWRAGKGFGISSTPTEGLGEGPDEVYRDAAQAAKRVVELLTKNLRTKPPLEIALAKLRGKLHISQEDLADALNLRQASVSKMERRSDMRVSTLGKVVRALGGDLEIRARFPDFEVKITQFDKPGNRNQDRGRRSRPVAR